jgi:hypothetical protein
MAFRISGAAQAGAISDTPTRRTKTRETNPRGGMFRVGGVRDHEPGPPWRRPPSHSIIGTLASTPKKN